ncbi:50S ribosomal protein L1 [bacterium DOLZORAL124_38_8]|nr:MAG: 50S ribosomal protein L1 [bacterium DOLZORAL124_38_8]
MAKISKSLKAAYEKFNRETALPIEEALKIMIETSTVKFDATAEVHFTLGIDPRHADQQLRATVSLPHGTGKTVRVAVIAEDDKHAEAKAAGATVVGAEELVDRISKGFMDFDVVVATPPMMRHLAKVARILGPRGMMPSPKGGTVTMEIDKTVKELVAGRLEFRNDKYGNVHTIFGKKSFGADKLKENFEAMVAALKAAKPTGAKGQFIQNVTINSTMGAGIKINLGEE